MLSYDSQIGKPHLADCEKRGARMCVGKPRGVQKGTSVKRPTEDATETLLSLLNELPVSDRSSCALSVASRLIEYAAFESAGLYSAEEVADLINHAARIDFASTDMRTAEFSRPQPSMRRMQ